MTRAATGDPSDGDEVEEGGSSDAGVEVEGADVLCKADGTTALDVEESEADDRPSKELGD